MRVLVLALLMMVPASVPEAAPTGGTVTGNVIVTRNGQPVKDREFVFAYLERAQRSPKKKDGVRATIAQKNQLFHPRVQVIPLRSKVDFPNQEKDPKVEHNVFSPTEPQFDLKRFLPGKSATQLFEFEGEYDIYCDLHSNMTAKVKVVDSDHITRVATTGEFTLANVPPGQYKLHVWTPKANEVIETITVVAGQTTALPHALKVPLKAPATTTHTRKDGTAYPACTYNGKQSCKPTDDIW
jgi:plastocyanin